MFIATLFTIAKTRKQPKCPSTDGLRRCGFIYIYVCMCIYIYIATRDYHTKRSKSEKGR